MTVLYGPTTNAAVSVEHDKSQKFRVQMRKWHQKMTGEDDVWKLYANATQFLYDSHIPVLSLGESVHGMGTALGAHNAVSEPHCISLRPLPNVPVCFAHNLFVPMWLTATKTAEHSQYATNARPPKDMRIMVFLMRTSLCATSPAQLTHTQGV